MKLQSTIIGFSLIAFSFACNNQNSSDNSDNQDDSQPDTAQQQVESPNNTAPSGVNNGGEVSDNALLTFATVNQKVQEINQQAQQEMMKVVEAGGMDVNRYSEILQAEQSPEVESDATAQEKEKFVTIAKELQVMQEQFQVQIDEFLKQTNTSEAEMQELAMQIQSDSMLMKRYLMLQQAQSPSN